jgi:hypothetical protein
MKVLIAPESYGWFSTIPVEPFRVALEDALNDTPTIEISTTALTALIAQQLIQNDIEVVQVLPADNILGDDTPGWVLEVRASYSAGVAFALAGKPGSYRLASPRANWRLLSWSDQRVFSYDLNANGVPELAIWDSSWGTGMTHYCEEHFALYEWKGDGFFDLSPNIQTSANTDSGDCLGFDVVEGPKGTKAITTGNLIDVGCSYGDYWRVGSLWLQRRYEWNGSYFALAGNALLPLDRSMPEGDLINKCTLSWVNEAGAENNQAFQLLPTLLAETSSALTTGFKEQFGPAYLDFFRFKLGTWYAMHGQQSQAVALLTQVRDSPVTPDFNTASQLAESFLEYYPVTGVFAGCAAANEVLTIEDFQSPNRVDQFYFNTSAMREAWGFSDWQWGLGGGSLFSGPVLRQDPMNVCSLITAFRLSIRDQSFISTENLTHWLTKQNIPYTGLEEGDVDNDGRRDWIILVGTGQEQSFHLWVLLNKGSFTLPLWASDIHRTTGNIPATWNTFKPYPLPDSLNVYQWTDGIIVFRVVSQHDWTGLDIVHQSIGYYQGEEFLGFTIQSVGTETLGNEAVNELRIFAVGKESWTPDWYVLGWDTAQNTLGIVASPQYNLDKEIKLVEDLIFEKANPIAATETISQILGTDNEPLGFATTKYGSIEGVRPYLLYLQGLAYEMSGDTQSAIHAYWSLWHDFPAYPLSYIAQQRLEKRQP